MSEINGSRSWREELASLVEDTGLRYTAGSFESKRSEFTIAGDSPEGESESLKDQVQGFLKAWGEMAMELGRGCRDIVQQSLVTQDSFIVQKLGGPCSEVSKRLSFLNDYFLPEDRDPVYSWTVILLVFLIAFAVLGVNTKHDSSIPRIKKACIHPPSASHVLLPDGRHMAYHELGVPADRARFSLIAPHSFLSSRLAGIPGIKEPLLEEFGVRLVTYDLPGFGESDPHPIRNLNSSALEMLYLANAIGINDKFWVLGHSSGAMHTWAALRYIPDRIAGAAMFAPMVNLDERRMTKEERQKTWEKWVTRRKLMHFFAQRFPRLLTYFYRQTFLSGKHGPINKWLAVSLGEKDKALVLQPKFEEFWHRDVEESIRQRNVKPFIEEAVLQVSNWGFSLTDLQVQKKCSRKGILPWLKSMYSQAECELTGFLRPIHIWQGMEDEVVPPSMTDYVSRILAGATVHKLQNEGHFSYFFFCDECHRQILTTLFGSPEGPLNNTLDATDSGTATATATATAAE